MDGVYTAARSARGRVKVGRGEKRKGGERRRERERTSASLVLCFGQFKLLDVGGVGVGSDHGVGVFVGDL